MTDCPSDNTLAELVRGELAPERSDMVARHLDGCAACAELVGMLGKALHVSPDSLAITILTDGADLPSSVSRPARVGRFIVDGLLGAVGWGSSFAPPTRSSTARWHSSSCAPSCRPPTHGRAFSARPRRWRASATPTSSWSTTWARITTRPSSPWSWSAERGFTASKDEKRSAAARKFIADISR